MILEEMLKEERKEGEKEGRALGKAEDIIEILSELGKLPEELKTRILNERNLDTLALWLKQAVKAESIEAFISRIS